MGARRRIAGGATVDAVEERGMELGDGVALLGSVKEPNLEEIIAADPDFLLLSADIAAQVDMHDALTSAGIPHAYYVWTASPITL